MVVTLGIDLALSACADPYDLGKRALGSGLTAQAVPQSAVSLVAGVTRPQALWQAAGSPRRNDHRPATTLAIVSRLEGKKVSLRVLSMSGNQALDTATGTGRLMLSVIGAVGQAEREAMLERQREGIAKAKREGRYKGRVPTARRQAAEIIRLQSAGVRPSEIAIKLGIGRASVYRVLCEQEKVAA